MYIVSWQLNDEEYNIPAMAETPTLESILNEDESSLLSEDDIAQFLPEEVIKLSYVTYFLDIFIIFLILTLLLDSK